MNARFTTLPAITQTLATQSDIQPRRESAGGPNDRVCAERLTDHETILALAFLLHRFDFEADPAYQLQVQELITLKPEGLRLRTRRRN
ncbi:putative cytochrome P450 (plasmid) [Rhodococcus opacus B4]|uniref:Putative cytochrome P450 n=1 Tax=Rhodococcus opacus (strain B4) TaxID=632772 RepID=C1BDK0_RHOOB|nr:putative cytochrome P450 [Rhodococcus opacus B4]